MKNIKFNLGWILAVAAALAMAAMGFMSMYYLQGGKLLWPIVTTVCMVVIPVLVTMQMAKAKRCSKPYFFHQEAVKEASFLGVMLLVCVASLFIVNHFFTVNSRTKEIGEIVSSQREQLKTMTADYNEYVDHRVKNYKATLKSIVDNRVGNEQMFEKTFIQNPNDTTGVARKITFKVGKLERNISIPKTNDSVSSILTSDDPVRWWQLPSIMNSVDSISLAVQTRYDVLERRAKNDSVDIVLLREYGADNPSLGIVVPEYWSYDYSGAEDIMNHFTERKGFVSSPWTVLAVVLGILLIMLPYFVEERDSRSKGLIGELVKDRNKKDDEDDDDDEIGIGTV